MILILSLFLQKGKQPAVEVKKPSQGIVYVAKEYPPWQQTVLKTLRKMYEENNGKFPENKDIMSALKTDDTVKKHMKKLMPFVAHLKVDYVFPIIIYMLA